MPDLHVHDSESLRAAIRVRETTAPVLLVAAILGWAALTLWVFTTDVLSAATLVPLIVLAASFEAVFALHLTASRLARYLQVAGDAGWEHLALSYRQRFGAIGANGLFTPIFGLAAVVNFVPAAVSGTVDELVGIGIAHGLFGLRLIIATRRATRLHDEDLARFRSLLSDDPATKSGPVAE
jgi:hypothetical protein